MKNALYQIHEVYVSMYVKFHNCQSLGYVAHIYTLLEYHGLRYQNGCEGYHLPKLIASTSTAAEDYDMIVNIRCEGHMTMCE